MLTEAFQDQKNEAFHQILERSMNNRFNSRPPKMEISGVLVPDSTASALRRGFKITTNSNEYRLELSPSLCQLAKKLLWEEVTAKGILDLETKIFAVERLSVRHSLDEMSTGSKVIDPSFDLEFYKKMISRVGRLEPDPGYLAS